MKCKYWLIILVGILMAVVVGCTSEDAPEEEGVAEEATTQDVGQGQGEYHDFDIELIWEMPSEGISEDEKEALNTAIDDEYKARATYEKVMDSFGEVRPFVNVQEAEEKHIEALLALYEKYSLQVPGDEWFELIPEFDSITTACEAAAAAEMVNVALYDELMGKVDNEDIIFVFTELQRASWESHLPAFQRCMEGRVR